jgi:hypothetical protein
MIFLLRIQSDRATFNLAINGLDTEVDREILWAFIVLGAETSGERCSAIGP